MLQFDCCDHRDLPHLVARLPDKREALGWSSWSSCSNEHSHMWLQPRRVPSHFGASCSLINHVFIAALSITPLQTTTAPRNSYSSELTLTIWRCYYVDDRSCPKGISMSSALRAPWICSLVQKELLDAYSSFETSYSPGRIVNDGNRHCSPISVTINVLNKHKFVQISEVCHMPSIFAQY